MSNSARGGDDVLTGGNSSGSGTVNNFLYGDATQLFDKAVGGADTLIAGVQSGGGSVTNVMWGDGRLSGSAVGGNDTFVFNDSFGNQNYVVDFHQGEDVLNIDGLSIDDLTITQVMTPFNSDTLINVTGDTANVVTLVGFTGTLTQDDFVALA
jgi:hypothetical protein